MGSSVSTVPRELELAANGTTGPIPYVEPAWKQELNHKVAAARARRLSGQAQVEARPVTEDSGADDAKSKAARVAAAVAARYAQAPTYQDYLASEVHAAMMAAVAAQAAANHARAAADAMYAEMNSPQLAAPAAEAEEQAAAETPAASVRAEATPETSRDPRPTAPPRVDHGASGFNYARSAAATSSNESVRSPQPSSHSLLDPVAEALVTPATPLPAKLLEFPRELIAARKARPRHAEGPLRDPAKPEPGQLRIFEVEQAAISTQAEAPPKATEWSSIQLGAYPDESYATSGRTERNISSHSLANNPTVTSKSRTQSYNGSMASAYSHASRSQVVEHTSLPGAAGIPDRLMAGIVDAALVGIAFALFVLVFTSSTAHPPSGKPALVGGAVLLTGLYLLYQFLFFTFAEATPGMRYARIALCTFDDDNPTRNAMRKRIFALVLAAAPLGLGFLYALFDEDHLGWHDRMTRMYQRSYK
jgi:uncharacterized RDD family membrane protein YckC